MLVRNVGYKKIREKYFADTSTSKYYAILKCSKSDTDDRIKLQYRRMVLLYHPDKLNSNSMSEKEIIEATEKFHEVQEAYTIIKKERGL